MIALTILLNFKIRPWRGEIGENVTFSDYFLLCPGYFLLCPDYFYVLNSFIRMVKAIIGALVQNSDTDPLSSR